jgi:hypothetical protein
MSDYITAKEFAERVGLKEFSVIRILWKDQKLPEDQRRIKGAIKQGTKERGQWLIPTTAAETWQPSPAGRKKRSK